MSWNHYYGFAPYVSVAQRRRKAEAMAKKMAKAGKALDPVVTMGRKIAATFWGKGWCDNLESYSDYSNRLPRGRTYVRNGSVIDLRISAGKVMALVQGSSLYTVEVTIASLTSASWAAFKSRCAGQISSLLDLLQGRLDTAVLQQITRRPDGLFPAPKEIRLSCSCPDGARMCKHVAATLYGVGARLDGKPELFFTLRGADMYDLITAATSTSIVAETGPAASGLEADDLSAIFGVEMESAAAPALRVRIRSRKVPAQSAVGKKKKQTASPGRGGT